MVTAAGGGVGSAMGLFASATGMAARVAKVIATPTANPAQMRRSRLLDIIGLPYPSDVMRLGRRRTVSLRRVGTAMNLKTPVRAQSRFETAK